MANELTSLKERLREANDAELRDLLAEFRREHFQLRMQAASSSLENPKRIRFVRKAVARILTAQTERAGQGEA